MRLLLSCLLTLIFVTAGFAADAPKQPNVLWLTNEDISADLGCYGVDYADTPVLDQMASEGIRYSHCFATSGVCAPARSCLIMGVYPSSIGSHHMRSQGERPEWMHQYPYYLREAGYYCTNNSKTDYNMPVEKGAWDDSSRNAHYKNRKEGQPFFAIFNYTATHESRMFGRHNPKHDPAKAPIPPYHPDHPLVREDWAHYHDNITTFDGWVGRMLKELDESGEADNTIVFYYSDHGAGMARGKRWLYDTGMHVPLIIKFGKNVKHLEPAKAGSTSDRLVSFVDFAPTLLSICGIDVPKHMQGKAFLGEQDTEPRDYVYGIRGRIDERYDMVRAVRDHRYKYIRNFMPHKTYALHVGYMYRVETMQIWQQWHDEGKLNPVQDFFFSERRPAEELYDTQADRWETKNLADSPEHAEILQRMRGELTDWIVRTRDVGLLAEPEMKDRPHREGFKTAYEWAHADESKYPIKKILDAAIVSQTDDDAEAVLIKNLQDSDPGVRFWAALNLNGRAPKLSDEAIKRLSLALADEQAAVRTEAAQALLQTEYEHREKIMKNVLVPLLSAPNEYDRLRAITVFDEIGEDARPYLAEFQEVKKRGGYPARVAEHVIEVLGK